MFIQNKRYDDRVVGLHYLIQTCWAKQRNNSLHEKDFPINNYSHIYVSRQMKPVKDWTIRGAWIIH